MRVLFTASEWAGHYFCMVPVAWALQAAGHEVRMTCKPSHADSIARSGLTAVPVADGPDMTTLARVTMYVEISMGRREHFGPLRNPFTGLPMGGPDDLDVTVEGPKFWKEVAEATQRGIDNVAAFARGWRPDLVIHDVMAPEGALSARLVGAPAVYCAPGLFGTVEKDEPGLDLRVADPVQHFERYGVGPWSRDHIEYAIDPSPSRAIPPLAGALRLPVRYTPYNGPAVVPDWLGPAEGRRVCVLWGNSATQMFGPEVPALQYAIEAAASAGDDVVLTANPDQVEALGALPSNVRVLRNFPLHLLLEVSDLVIHHGSDNTMMNAAVAGIPHVGLGLNDDHAAFGRRMDPLGASITLKGLSATREEVRQAVETALNDPSFRAAAAVLQADILAQPEPARLVPALERLAETGSLSAGDVPRAQEPLRT